MLIEKKTQVSVGQVSRSSVLHLIKRHGPVSRASVARMLNMSRSTISAIVDGLIREGRIYEGETGESTSAGGRKPILLHYLPRAKYAFGVDIGATKTTVVITDLAGEVIKRKVFASFKQGNHPFTHILSELKTFVSESELDLDKIAGIGIGLPGVTDHQAGVLLNSPGFHLTNFPARDFFSELPGPIWIDNNVNMWAIGEQWTGAARDLNHFVLVAVGTGIGAGLIVNGEIYRGAAGSAGEIGHLHVDPFFTGPKRTLEDFGPLERLSSGKGIVDQAHHAVSSAPIRTTSEIFDLAANGQQPYADVIESAISYLAFSIANMVTLLNPDMIIVGGGVTGAGERLLGPLRERVAYLSPTKTSIVLAGLGEDGAAIGGAATALLRLDEIRLGDAAEERSMVR